MTNPGTSTSSPNGLWTKQEATYEPGEQPSRQTAEQWVLNWFEALEAEARRVLREAGLPDQPGFIFQASAGALEFVPTDLGAPIPKELLDRQEAGEGKITRWPNNLTIEELTPPYFARSVLFHLRDISDELKRRQPDPWRVAKNALAIAHPYFCMSVEQSGLSDKALAGVKAREDAQGAALANKKIAAERLPIVDRLAREVLSEPGSAKRKSARWIAERIEKRLQAELAKASLRPVQRAQIQRDLTKLGY